MNRQARFVVFLLATSLAGAAAVAVAGFSLLVFHMGTCGQNAGFARDSPQGHVCDFIRSSPINYTLDLEITVFAGLAVLLGVVAVWLGARWTVGRGAPGRFAFCLALVIGVPAVTTIAVALLPDECSAEQQRLYNEWDRRETDESYVTSEPAFRCNGDAVID